MVVELRAFTPADGAALASWIPGPVELLTWAGPGFTWPLDDRQLAAYAADPDRRTWMAADQDGRLVGHASLRRHADGASARLGRVLVAPAARGHGHGAALLTQVLSLAFTRLGVDRIDLGVFRAQRQCGTALRTPGVPCGPGAARGGTCGGTVLVGAADEPGEDGLAHGREAGARWAVTNSPSLQAP
ncbi:GNAT family N-acetyltransferase [Streptomyces sp. NPDC059134]|uniref:GNAT family N-acetyltransferase n=1 Tax=Streptomyces sp. NPDC059134 TaxID=3346738 RepID=UPI0036779290